MRLQTAICCLMWIVPCEAAPGGSEPKLELSGVSGPLEVNLRAGLSLAAEPCSTPRWRVRQLFKQADQELDKAARALGYYHIQLKKRLQFQQDCWQASFAISPGEALHFSEVSIVFEGEADADPAFLKLLQETPLRPGAQVHHGHYEAFKQQIESLAADRGYFDGRFVHQALQVEPEASRASIRLHYDSGRRYRIGRLNLEQTVYDPSLIERYVKIRPGAPYAAGELAAQHRALADSGYFQSVAVRPDFKGATDGLIDIDVQLIPRKRMAYKLGVGAATDTGPRVTLAYERRRLNRFGHRFQSRLLLSEVDSSLGLEYIIPMQRPHIDQLSFRSGYRKLDTSSSTSDSYTFGVRLQGMRGNWKETRYLDWLSEHFKIGNETSTAEVLVPGISWSRTKSDNRMHPRKGFHLRTELRGAHEELFSTASFMQILAAGKSVRPLGSGRVLLRAETGYSITPDFTALPASYRFFAGGDRSVRGYAYRSLGTRDEQDEVIGGRHLLTASLEFEYPIKGEWAGALFADTGNAFEDWGDELRSAWGFGLRWRSPIGAIRLDLAFPDDQSKDQFRIHFSMGPDL